MKAKRMLGVLCLSVLPAQVWAQAPAAAGQAASASAAPAASTDDLKQLKEQIAQQEAAIKQLQESLSQQRALLDKAVKEQEEQKQSIQAAANATAPAKTGNAPQMVPVANVVPAAGPRVSQQSDQQPRLEASPLSISLGNTTLTPLGFLDATFFWRSTNVGSGIGTNFGGIPYNNTVAGNLSETNFSAQNSRLGFRVDSKLMGWNVLGYLETDFLFNNDANSFQIGSNSAGLRLRNYFVDVNNGKFEFLGGQDWSMLTPNRKGLSPIPSDIFYTQNMDTNYQIGLVWSRDPQFRFVWHPSDHVAWGFSLENPQQYLGGGNGTGAATLPSNLSGISGEFQSNQSATGVPNLAPDIASKLAFDSTPGGKAMHLEIAGFMSSYRDYIPAGTATPAVAGYHSAVGGGGEINSNLELFKNFHLIENTFFSNGGGRYLFGSAPDMAVRPDGSISLINSYSTVDGFEAQVTKKTLLAMYYGGMYVNQDAITNANGQVSAGYGYPASGSGKTAVAASGPGNNRYIQELTFDWVQTLWKNKNYGALSLINQYSYVFREPWYVSPGSPIQAHDSIVYVDVRYTLP